MQYDYIVIGAGSMGLATGYALAKEGHKTLMLDAFNPPHDKGSHHGDTRLIRFAYGEGIRYVPFVLRAKQLWDELQVESGCDLFSQTGVLNFAPQGDAYIQRVIESAELFGIPLEVLTAEQANKRWEGLKLTDDLTICLETTAGVLYVENILKSYIKLAQQYGAVLRGNSRVQSIEQQPDETVVVTVEDGQTFQAKGVVVTVGAWATQLMKQTDLDIPVTPIRKTFAWYEADEELYSDAKFPGFAYIDGEIGYYGFPSIDGKGLKVGRHDSGEEVKPDAAKRPFGGVKGDQEDLDQFLATYMPNVGALKYGKTCMYSMTPDSDFILDVHPKFQNIVLAAGFSGHGFKFASAVGEALKDMITNQPTKVDLSPFKLARF